MARARLLKPEFWTSPQIVGRPLGARLLFMGLWNFSDDRGVHPSDPLRLKMQIFPADTFSINEIAAWLAELIECGLLREFTAQDGARYLHVTGWEKHQTIQRPSYRYPEPPSYSATTHSTVLDDTQHLHSISSEQTVSVHTEAKRSEDETEEKEKPKPKPKRSVDPVRAHFGNRKLDEQTLRDNSKLLAWAQDAARLGIIEQTESHLLNVFALAEGATTKGRANNPVAWFNSAVQAKAWDRITEADDESGRRRLKAARYPSQPRTGGTVTAADAVASLNLGGDDAD